MTDDGAQPNEDQNGPGAGDGKGSSIARWSTAVVISGVVFVLELVAIFFLALIFAPDCGGATASTGSNILLKTLLIGMGGLYGFLGYSFWYRVLRPQQGGELMLVLLLAPGTLLPIIVGIFEHAEPLFCF